MKCRFEHKFAGTFTGPLNVLVEGHGLPGQTSKFISSSGGIGEDIAQAARDFLVTEGPRHGIKWFALARSAITFRMVEDGDGYANTAVVPFHARVVTPPPLPPAAGAPAVADTPPASYTPDEVRDLFERIEPAKTKVQVDDLAKRLYKLGLWADQLADPDRHLEITLSDDQWEVTVYTRDVDHPEVENVTHSMGTFGVIRAESKNLARAITAASEACSRVVRGVIGDEATRAALSPTLMGNPLIDSSTRQRQVLDALVRCHEVLKLANDGNQPGERCVHDLGIWIAATDRLVQRIDELGGVMNPLGDVLRDLLHQSSPSLACGASSVGEPPAAGDALSDPAAGEGVSS